MTRQSKSSLHAFMRLYAAGFQDDAGACIKDSVISLNHVPRKSDFPASTNTFTVPSLSLFRSNNTIEVKSKTEDFLSSQDNELCEKTTNLAVQNLSALKAYGKSDVSKARSDMALNMKKSLLSLIRANFRNFFKMQAKTYLPTDSMDLNEKLDNIVSAFMGSYCDEISGDSKSHPVNLCDVTIRFCELKDRCSEESDNNLTSDGSKPNTSKHVSAMQPFTFEASLSVEIYGCMEVVTLSAPGNITGTSSSSPSYDFENIQVSINTVELLKSMRNHARLIVLKAITSKNLTLMPSKQNHPMPLIVEEVFGPQKTLDIHVFASLSLASLIAENCCSVSTCEVSFKKRMKQKQRARDMKRMRLSSRLTSLKKSYQPSTPSSLVLGSQIRALGKYY